MSPDAFFVSIENEMIAWRRELHQNPELGFQEVWTSDFVAKLLTAFGYEVHRGLGQTGVVGTLRRGAGPSIGLRSDMDALPIYERTNLSHASRTAGKMHACGHDGHMAMLLGAAKWFAMHANFAGTLHLIFQPAEELGKGAAAMIEDGLFDLFPMDAVYGMHNMPGVEEGVVTVRVGTQMAAIDLFDITLTGQGAHAAQPHLGQDVLLAAGQLHTQLQSIISRNLDPQNAAVISVTQIHGGDSCNVLPESATVSGCTRHLDKPTQAMIEKRMAEVVAGITTSFGIQAHLDYRKTCPASINTPNETAIATKAAISALGADKFAVTEKPLMGSEDFAFMLEAKPGAFVFLGAGNQGPGCVLHGPTYDFNDRILTSGARYWAALADAAFRGA